MRILDAGYKHIVPLENEIDILRKIEGIARVCYKSEELNTYNNDDVTRRFVMKLIHNGHHSMLEHYSFSILFTVDRGVTHEAVRHRLASFAQESTRYCNYTDNKFNNEITVIQPPFFEAQTRRFQIWIEAMMKAEKAYFELIDEGCTPQEARCVLPNSTKADIVITANIREWRHILSLRASPRAHPQMQEIMCQLLHDLTITHPVLFGTWQKGVTDGF